MAATIFIAALVVAGFILSVYLRRFSESPAAFFAQLAFAVYLVAAAIKAWMNEDRVFAHTTLALIALAALGTLLYRRMKSGRAG